MAAHARVPLTHRGSIVRSFAGTVDKVSLLAGRVSGLWRQGRWRGSLVGNDICSSAFGIELAEHRSQAGVCRQGRSLRRFHCPRG